jgi:DNA polymerase III epsilon subunit-like protein
MQHTTNVLKIPGRYGDFKWPKLEEAYKHYYGEIFSGAHDALVDVRACRDVFLKVYKEESIKQ